MRPYWKGYLKLALVSCPIALHAACSSAERIALRQINKATGNRLRQQLIDEETREPVAPEHKGRGYEVAKGQYLIVEDAELDAIEIESTHTIEIDSFVPHAQLDQRFFDTPYYVRASEPVGQEAFAVIREAMRGKGMVGLGRLVLSKRERVIALEPTTRGCSVRRCAIPTKCARPRITSAIYRTSPSRRTCSRAPRTLSIAKPLISIPRLSATATRRRCWRT
jgi:DNA end-binding protein Ku